MSELLGPDKKKAPSDAEGVTGDLINSFGLPGGEDEQHNFFFFDIRIIRNLTRLWRNRYLVFALAQRGIRARYKQSLLGAGWALLTPLAMTAVVIYMYSALGINSNEDFPCPKVVYLLFTLAFWNFFTRAVGNGSTSLVSNMDLVTKVYFPREVLPISSVLMNMVDLLLAFGLWVVVAAGFSVLVPGLGEAFGGSAPYYPHWGWLWIPVLLGFLLMLILGVVFITGALQVYFRDVSHVISLGMNLWLIITPVLYPLGMFPGGKYTQLVNMNPMTGLIDGLRLAVISRQSPWMTRGMNNAGELVNYWENHVVGACIFSVLIFLVGYCFFKHEERYFADVV